MAKTKLSKGKLLSMVNADLKKEPWYLKGLKIIDARMYRDSLILTPNLDSLPIHISRSLNSFSTRYSTKYELR